MEKSVLALVLVVGLVAFSPLAGLAGADGDSPAVEFISSQRERLSALASILESEGLPVGLDLERVMEALERAEGLAEQEPEEAIAEALEALNASVGSLAAALANESVLANVSERRALERAIEVKWAHLERLKDIVAELEELNATISGKVYDNIGEIEALLNESQSLLEEGNVSGAARAMARASKLLGQTVSLLAREARDEFSWASASLAMARGLEEAAERLAETIDAVEEAIRSGDLARAESMLEKVVKGLERLSSRLDRIIEVVEEAGVPERVVERLHNMSTTLSTAREELALALEALREGDVLTATQLLESAREELEKMAGLLEGPGVPEKAREIIAKVKQAVKTKGVAPEEVLEARGPEGVGRSVEATLRLLEALKERYTAGKISEATYNKILEKIEEAYMKIIERIQSKPMPEPVKNRILERLGQVIQWIEENRA